MRVAIKNTSSGETLSKDAVVLKGAISKGLGLMGKRKTDGALFVLRRESKMDSTIHMLFMLMSLDVIWTNKNGIVVDIKRNVKPTSFFDIQSWKFHTPKKKAKYIIELPAGIASKTKIDDALHFDYSE
jgi:uncharacterized membrane protein (UPF0127 family)